MTTLVSIADSEKNFSPKRTARRLNKATADIMEIAFWLESFKSSASKREYAQYAEDTGFLKGELDKLAKLGKSFVKFTAEEVAGIGIPLLLSISTPKYEALRDEMKGYEGIDQELVVQLRREMYPKKLRSENGATRIRPLQGVVPKLQVEAYLDQPGVKEFEEKIKSEGSVGKAIAYYTDLEAQLEEARLRIAALENSSPVNQPPSPDYDLERIERSHDIEVLEQHGDEFVTHNPSNGNFYVVRPLEENPKQRCECGDSHFRGVKCKHQIAVENIVASLQEIKIESESAPRDPHSPLIDSVSDRIIDDNGILSKDEESLKEALLSVEFTDTQKTGDTSPVQNSDSLGAEGVPQPFTPSIVVQKPTAMVGGVTPHDTSSTSIETALYGKALSWKRAGSEMRKSLDKAKRATDPVHRNRNTDKAKSYESQMLRLEQEINQIVEKNNIEFNLHTFFEKGTHMTSNNAIATLESAPPQIQNTLQKVDYDPVIVAANAELLLSADNWGQVKELTRDWEQDFKKEVYKQYSDAQKKYIDKMKLWWTQHEMLINALHEKLSDDWQYGVVLHRLVGKHWDYQALEEALVQMENLSMAESKQIDDKTKVWRLFVEF